MEPNHVLSIIPFNLPKASYKHPPRPPTVKSSIAASPQVPQLGNRDKLNLGVWIGSWFTVQHLLQSPIWSVVLNLDSHLLYYLSYIVWIRLFSKTYTN